MFDAGSALIEYYRSIDDTDASNALLTSLIDRALFCDMAVVKDCSTKSIDLENGHAYTNSDPDVNQLWVTLDERLRTQTNMMTNGCTDMITMFIEAYNAVHLNEGQASHDASTKYSKINDIYSDLMANALEAGGSPSDVAEDVEYELGKYSSEESEHRVMEAL